LVIATCTFTQFFTGRFELGEGSSLGKTSRRRNSCCLQLDGTICQPVVR